MAKPFFYRIDLIDLMDFATEPAGQTMSLLEFAKELKKGESDHPAIQKIINEAFNYIEKKKIAGSSGGKAKASSAIASLSSALAKPSTPLARSSNRNSTETETLKDLAQKTRKPPSGDHKFFTEWWCFAFEKLFKSKYPYTAKDAANVKMILNTFNKVGSAASYGLYVLLSDEPYYDNVGRTIGMLTAQMASLKSRKLDWEPLIKEGREKGIIPADGIKFEDWKFWEITE